MWWLRDRGVSPTERNVEVEGGEIDIIARDGPTTVAVEVRTTTSTGDPIDAIGWAKRRHVSTLARRAGVSRVDFLGVGIRDWGIEVHWVPGSTR